MPVCIGTTRRQKYGHNMVTQSMATQKDMFFFIMFFGIVTGRRQRVGNVAPVQEMWIFGKNDSKQKHINQGHGVVLVVRIHPFYSDDLSSNLVGIEIIFWLIAGKTKRLLGPP